MNNNDIDNVAYELYEKEYFEKYSKDANVFTKDFFLYHKECFFEYYDNAEKYIRKKKLIQLSNV